MRANSSVAANQVAERMAVAYRARAARDSSELSVLEKGKHMYISMVYVAACLKFTF